MKNRIKIGLKVLLVLGIVSLFLGIAPRHTSASVVGSPDAIINGTYNFKNAVTIVADLGGQKVNFVADPNPIYITDIIYKAQGYDCGNSKITIKDSNIQNIMADPSKLKTAADVNIDYNPNKSGCKSTTPDSIPKIIGNADLGVAFFEQIDTKTIKSVTTKSSITFTLSSDGLFYKNGEKNCVDRIRVYNDQLAYYELDSNKGQSVPGPDIGLGDIGSCKLLRMNFQDIGSIDDAQKIYNGQQLKLAGALQTSGASPSGACSGPPIACRNTSGAGTAANESSDPNNADEGTCELNSSGFSLSWVMCPLLASANAFSNTMISLFEKELSFSVTQDLTKNSGQDKIKTTWSLIKDISSAVLVIILLIMVISQAIDFGPFDAYTIRKVLPRLIIAVIAMQLSWAFFAWVVNIFNDFGNGLGDLMYAPFGGPDNLKLGGLLANAHIGTASAAAINYIALLPVLVLSISALPTLLSFAVGGIVSIMVGVGVLIFRKILILMCLIFAPIALLSWILPGTERYWKLWKDNFLKALTMFPIAVALIAAGRIFAYTVGTQSNGTFLNFIVVMVGFFGPLFLLPKTFRWGGSLMSTAGGYVGNFGSRVQKAVEPGVKGYAERYQGRKGKAYDPKKGLWDRSLRRVQSGHIFPSERSRRLTIAKGDKWASDRNDEAQALVGRAYEKALTRKEGYDRTLMDKNGNYQKYMQDEEGNYLKYKRDEDGRLLNSDDEVVTSKVDAELVKVDRAEADKVKVNSKAEASVDNLTGVAAGKQALVDIAGNSGGSDASKRAAQAATKQLLDTSSWIEMQNARIQGGAYDGMRVSETANFKNTLSNSPQHYSATIKSRPDMAPDVIESAEKKAKYTYAEAKTPERIQVLDRLRIKEAVDRLTPDALPSAHYGFFEDIARMKDPDLSSTLRDTLIKFKNSGQIGENAVASLRGAEEKHVDEALSYAPADPEKPRILKDFFPSRETTASAPSGSSAVAANVATGGATRPAGVATPLSNAGSASSSPAGRAGTTIFEQSITREDMRAAVEGGMRNALRAEGGMRVPHDEAPQPQIIIPNVRPNQSVPPGARPVPQAPPPSTPPSAPEPGWSDRSQGDIGGNR